MNIVVFHIGSANVFTIKSGTDLDDSGPFDIPGAATTRGLVAACLPSRLPWSGFRALIG